MNRESRKFKKAAASLEEMLETISPYLPEGKIVSTETKRKWRLPGEDSQVTHKEKAGPDKL